MQLQYRCLDCHYVFPEAQLARWIGEFGAYLGCPKCQADDLIESVIIEKPAPVIA